jgi:hypothetical protein
MNEASPSFEIHQTASIAVRPVVLPRAYWPSSTTIGGRGVVPQKGTWYGHVSRGTSDLSTTVVAMISCPACGGLNILTHSEAAAKAVGKMLGRPVVPVAHQIDSTGRVSPDLLCMHGSCDFHRTVYLDRWNKTKPLYAIVYTRGPHGRIEIAYAHAVDQKEARLHLGAGDYRIIDIAPAIGFFVDEKTGRMTAD